MLLVQQHSETSPKIPWETWTADFIPKAFFPHNIITHQDSKAESRSKKFVRHGWNGEKLGAEDEYTNEESGN